MFVLSPIPLDTVKPASYGIRKTKYESPFGRPSETHQFSTAGTMETNMKKIKRFRSSACTDGTYTWTITTNDGRDHRYWMESDEFVRLVRALCDELHDIAK